jgi:hypothetical protein
MTFTFTQAQSSCIASATVNGQEVQISFQSNPSKSYDFVTDNADSIVEFLRNPGDVSIGKMYRNWISEQVLIPSENLVTA